MEFAEVEFKVEGFKFGSHIKTDQKMLHENCGLEVKKVEVGIIKKILKPENVGVQLKMPLITERGELECSPMQINDGKALSDILNS